MITEKIQALRRDYSRATLDVSSTDPNPIRQFDKWFKEALDSKVLEPNAMVLSTVSTRQEVSSRMVLLKDFDENGLTFYTNYESQKGQDLQHNPYCSLLFPWIALERQVIVQGQAQKVARATTKAYFHSRPRSSQIGAWVSQQSREVSSRQTLEKRKKMLEEQFEGEKIPTPDYWGGYLVEPCCFEFWQGRSSRLHDRIIYEKTGNIWQRKRLSP